MQLQPTFDERPAQPYVAVTARVPMRDLGAVVPPLIPEVFDWLHDQQIAPAGPPFFRYVTIDMDGELEIEAGVPITAPAAANGRVHAGVLTPGRYATVTHTGDPSSLEHVTAELLGWAQQVGVEWQVFAAPDGEMWAGRYEFYLTDPAVEPDTNAWVTRLAFLTERE